jgi:hypothetical protein
VDLQAEHDELERIQWELEDLAQALKRVGQRHLFDRAEELAYDVQGEAEDRQYELDEVEEEENN